jgi:hypothetical protein
MLARVMAASVQPTRPIQASMQRKLESLTPVVLNIVNESHKHAGHSGRLAEPPTPAGRPRLQLDLAMLLDCTGVDARTVYVYLTVSIICSRCQRSTLWLAAVWVCMCPNHCCP